MRVGTSSLYHFSPLYIHILSHTGSWFSHIKIKVKVTDVGKFGFARNSVLTSKKSEQTEKSTTSLGTIRRRPVASKTVNTDR